MNTTERRAMYRSVGLPLPKRTLSDEQLDMLTTTHTPSNQQSIRVKVERFVTANMDVLKETLDCHGNCADSSNTCPDAQAAACYLMNQQAVDNS
jgi:hypothetical protein